MTTIVIVGDSIASDSQMTVGFSMPAYGVKKIHDLGDCYIGIAGCAYQGNAVLNWLKHGSVPEEKPHFANYTEASHYELIGLDKETGVAFAFSGAEVNYLELPKPLAVGSGGPLALTALNTMKATKQPLDAKMAIKMAILGDVYSGGSIKSYTIDRKKAKAARLKRQAADKAAEVKEPDNAEY